MRSDVRLDYDASGAATAVETVEIRPHVCVRRDVALRLGLIAPRLPGRRPVASATIPEPEVMAPPTAPSLADLAAPPAVSEPDAPVPATVPQRPRPRPVRRSLASILAASERGFRQKAGR